MTNLIVTVGTSLFESASWSKGLTTSIPAYEDWLKPECLDDPTGRAKGPHAATIRKELLALLSNDADAIELTKLWADPKDNSAHPKRYSAEVCTMMRLAAAEEKTFGDWLRAYESIRFVAPRNDGNESRIAADFLKQVLQKTGARIDSHLLVADDVTEAGADFHAHLRACQGATDVIVSGGYKIYATMAGRWLGSCGNTVPCGPDRRVLYLHEGSEHVIIEQAQAVTNTARPTRVKLSGQ
ncbi:MAG: hypothetical protein H6807_16430 [Planctomycetes bacterium]|nr:hypothetical protein [Planctomycetota bacterium]